MIGPAAVPASPLPAGRVRDILARLARVRVAICGDFCLDAYWMLDPRGGEISAETGLRAQAVARHACSPGGAGNIVANVAALGCAHVRAIGVIGEDLFGRELVRQLDAIGADTAAMVVQREGFDTVTYGKRYAGEREEPRIDFGFFNARHAATEATVLAHLSRAVDECDAVVINQQVPGSLSETFLAGVHAIVDRRPEAIVVCDSRHYGDRITGAHRKINEAEAARIHGVELARGAHAPVRDLEAWAARLYAGAGRPVFITRGPLGILTVDAGGIHHAPAVELDGPTDTVGAGDTVTGALALCLGAGLAPAEAAGFANLAAAVTVRKLRCTGTATPAEVLALCAGGGAAPARAPGEPR